MIDNRVEIYKFISSCVSGDEKRPFMCHPVYVQGIGFVATDGRRLVFMQYPDMFFDSYDWTGITKTVNGRRYMYVLWDKKNRRFIPDVDLQKTGNQFVDYGSVMRHIMSGMYEGKTYDMLHTATGRFDRVNLIPEIERKVYIDASYLMFPDLDTIFMSVSSSESDPVVFNFSGGWYKGDRYKCTYVVALLYRKGEVIETDTPDISIFANAGDIK